MKGFLATIIVLLPIGWLVWYAAECLKPAKRAESRARWGAFFAHFIDTDYYEQHRPKPPSR